MSTLRPAKQYGKVCVLAGGHNAEAEVSRCSGQCVYDALIDLRIDAHLCEPTADNLCRIINGEFDRVFLVLHGDAGENGAIQSLLTQANIPYTGSPPHAAALSMDKHLSQLLWHSQGLPIPQHQVVNTYDELVHASQSLGFPLAVKPTTSGSSCGVSKVAHHDQLHQSFDTAKQYGTVMVEQWIEGHEYSVAMVGEYILPCIEIIPQTTFYDYTAKYTSDETHYLCPTHLNAADESALQALAHKAYTLLGMQGWGRIDIMRDTQGNLFLLEANSTPGMTTHSLVPKEAAALGWRFTELVERILDQTI